MPDIGETNGVLLGIAALFTAINLGPILLKKYQSKGEVASTQQTINASTNLHIEAADKVVKIVQEELTRQVTENRELAVSQGKLETVVADLKDRLFRVEERERQGLVRQAHHEAWDTMTYKKILTYEPDWPTPPALTSMIEVVETIREHGYGSEESLTGGPGAAV